MVARSFRIVGLVQGVGFRWFVRTQARKLGLAGWVRNRPDGSVDLVARGPEPLVSALSLVLAKGPAGARVDRVEESPWLNAGALPDPFRIE